MPVLAPAAVRFPNGDITNALLGDVKGEAAKDAAVAAWIADGEKKCRSITNADDLSAAVKLYAEGRAFLYWARQLAASPAAQTSADEGGTSYSIKAQVDALKADAQDKFDAVDDAIAAVPAAVVALPVVDPPHTQMVSTQFTF